MTMKKGDAAPAARPGMSPPMKGLQRRYRSRFTFLALVAVLAPLFWACELERGPAVVEASFRDAGGPLAGATVELRLAGDTAVTAITDSAGQVRFEMAGAGGAASLDLAPGGGDERAGLVYAPLLISRGDSAVMEVAVDESVGRQARYLTETRMARWGRAAQALAAIEHDHYAAYRSWVAAGQPGSFEPDLSRTMDSIRSWLDEASDAEVRSALWVALLTALPRRGNVAAEEADAALREISPSAAIWALRPSDVAKLAWSAAATAEGSQDPLTGHGRVSGRAEVFVDAVIDAHDGREMQAQILLSAVRQSSRVQRLDKARSYYRQLMVRHPASPLVELAAKDLPDPALRVGRPIPSVPLPALDSAEPAVTPAELAGPATLVDFWAAWCTPCVAEMPVIHAAYERFRSRGFDVVSVSFDRTREDVQQFRNRYAMPWRHAFVGEEKLGDGVVASAWGVSGLPSAYLVGPRGEILALEQELRGDRLEKTLERVLEQ